MITEVLKLDPQIDKARLEQMFNTLTNRFKTLAKKFGDGLKFTAKLAGPLALVAGFVAKILNPLEKAEEIIERIMGRAGDITDAADDYQTETGKLFKLQSIAGSKGVDPDMLRMMLGKFQTALVKERDMQAYQDKLKSQGGLKPGEELETDENGNPVSLKPGVLREFTSEKDTAEAFFQFMQSVRELPRDMQVKIQNEIFGEKMRGRVVAFLNTPKEEIQRLNKDLPSVPTLTKSVDKANTISDEREILRSVTDAKTFVSQTSLLDMTMAKQLDKINQARNLSDNDAVKRFGPASALELEMLATQRQIEGMLTDLMTKYMPDALKFIREGKEAIDYYGEYIKNDLWPGIKQGFDDAVDGVLQFKTDITETFSNALTSITETVDKVTSGIGGLFTKVGDVTNSIQEFFFKGRGR